MSTNNRENRSSATIMTLFGKDHDDLGVLVMWTLSTAHRPVAELASRHSSARLADVHRHKLRVGRGESALSATHFRTAS